MCSYQGAISWWTRWYRQIMKLKTRMFIAPMLCIGVFAFITVYQSNVINNLFGEPDPDLKPSIRDFMPSDSLVNVQPFQSAIDLKQSADALETGAPARTQRDHVPVHKLVDTIKAHLPVPRKDLDISNYTSNGDNTLSSNKHLDLQDLQEFVKNDSVIRENADTIIEIAHILEQTHHKTKEVVEHRGESEKTLKLSPKQEETAHERSDKEAEAGDNGANLQNAIQIAPAFRPFDGLLPEDEVMLKFELPHEIVGQLEQYMAKDKELGRRVHPPSTKKLDVHRTSFTHSKLLAWEQFQNHITQHRLYDPDSAYLRDMMQSMAHDPLSSYYQDERGTQLKLVYFLATHQQVMFKPMRYPREQETLPDHFYFSDFERHNAEIAAFHLDMVLGFNRVPPTVGRRINVTYDVKRQAKPALLKTFFISPAGNICFHGECDYYCDTGHAVCGHPDIMEGSMQAYLPSSRKVKRKTWKHPWKRSYHKRNKAEWETDNKYCARVKHTAPYDTGRRLLDLMDMAVFDFLTGNMDRHHYETFTSFGNFTFPILMDNGRGFGKSRHDELSILAPLYQCCLIRYSTLQKLVDFHKGPVHLSNAMRTSMAQDIAQPVLLEAHFVALDRRVKIMLKTVHKCIERNGYLKVVQNDGF